MGPVNNLQNRINTWNDAGISFKSVVGSRVLNLAATIPAELVAIAENIILTPIYAASTILKMGPQVVALVSGSKAVQRFADKIPGFTDLLRTIARIVAYSIGTFLTATFGVVISPKANFIAHCAMGLAINRKQEAIQAAHLEKEIAENKRSQEELASKLEAEKIALEIQRIKEQEAVDTLNHIEKQAKEAIQEDIAPKLPSQELAIDAAQAIEETEAEEEEYEYNYEDDYEDVLEEFQPESSLASRVLDTALGGVLHPLEATKSVYNYASGLFSTQKA